MKKRVTTKSSEADRERVDALKGEVIDTSDIPEVPPEMFAKAMVRRGLKAAPR